MHNVPKRENKIMSIAGAAHNVNIFGSGETTVVLGHGFGSDQSVWKHLVPHLVDHYRVVLYDNIGAGTTNPNHYNFDRYSTIEGYALDLISILEEFNVGKCICVGHSLSAMVATTASIFRPDLFHKLIIMCANPRMTNTDDYCGGFEQADIDQLNAAMEWNYEASVASIPPMVIGGDINSVAMREYNRTLFNMRPDIALHVFHTLTSLDLRPYLPSVTVPCHIIQTSKDLFVPVAVGEYLHHYLGGKSIMEVINTEGHLPHLSAPDVTIPVLLRHIMYDIS